MIHLARPKGIPQRKGNYEALNSFFLHGLAEKDITVAELSRRCGMNDDSLRQIFNDAQLPHIYNYIKICKALDLDLAEGLELLWDGGNSGRT